MHDWTLIRIIAAWKDAEIIFEFKDETSSLRTIKANSFSKLTVPRLNEWGPSVSVNKIIGPMLFPDGTNHLQIQMQSGDMLELIAKNITMP
jgi:hypothetical protein